MTEEGLNADIASIEIILSAEPDTNIHEYGWNCTELTLSMWPLKVNLLFGTFMSHNLIV